MKSPERELTPRAGSTHGVSSLGSRYPWVLLWSPVLLSSPLHTICPDGADGGGLPWPCVDEVVLQPSSSGWGQGPLTRLSLLLRNWLRDGQSVSALLGTGAWGPKQVRPLPKVTVCIEIRESGAQAWQGQENGAEWEAELEAQEQQRRQQRPRPLHAALPQLGLDDVPMSLGETRLCVHFCSS